MKHCLIISTYFPPIGGIAAQRITKFVKYLPDFNWKPIVITVPIGSTRLPEDASLLKEIPAEIDIYRPYYLDYKKIVHGEIAKLIKPLTRKHLYPDRYRVWNYFALKHIRKIIAKQKIDVVFANISPFSTLLLAADIKKEFGLPVVINLRDAFSFNYYTILKNDRKEIERALKIEKNTFPIFDSIICVTPHMMKTYQSLFPDIKDLFQLITNGYDEDDFYNLDLKHDTNTFSIGYNGSISRQVPIEPILTAIYTIYKNYNIKIKLNIATKNPLSKIKSKCPACFDAGMIDYKGFLSHRESLINLGRSLILTFMLENSIANEGVYSGKIFEYLRMNRPIVLLNNKTSDVARLVQETKSGTCVDIDNQDEIITSILNYYHLWKENRLLHTPSWDKIKQFDYRNLTKKLTCIFDSIINIKPMKGNY